MVMTVEEGLAPCPFCGAREETGAYPTVVGWTDFWVECVCDARGPSCKSRDEAIERWNTRFGEGA